LEFILPLLPAELIFAEVDPENSLMSRADFESGPTHFLKTSLCPFNVFTFDDLELSRVSSPSVIDVWSL
jgi:hypothetical protein